MLEKISNANFPLDSEGRTYHVSTGPGQTANRILTVGDPARLHRISKHLDEWPEPFERVSQRGYTTITGRYKGVPISLIAIGMGVAMTDFFVREVRAVVQGDLAIVRFGSCGSLDPSLKVGSLGVPEQSLMISTNYNYFHPQETEDGGKEEPYLVSNPIKADAKLQRHLFETLETEAKDEETEVRSLKLHASADCFYSSQGRIDANFQDDNKELISTLLERNPDCASLEMETAHLLHLASIASPSLPIAAAAVHMVFAGRAKEGGQGDFIDPKRVASLEPRVGKACLDALVAWDIPEEKLHPEVGSVWEYKEKTKRVDIPIS
ncbi:nucleoside phosphorylase [Sporobolomyces salmoneus]|uniref:nucleoside phosphorylase n=1 Tax=Sporobolomyces salmoneus TaxID=183962 RepID=UPI00316F6D03